nr:hypothetical protein CFP56_46666 [Quercus suber]
MLYARYVDTLSSCRIVNLPWYLLGLERLGRSSVSRACRDVPSCGAINTDEERWYGNQLQTMAHLKDSRYACSYSRGTGLGEKLRVRAVNLFVSGAEKEWRSASSGQAESICRGSYSSERVRERGMIITHILYEPSGASEQSAMKGRRALRPQERPQKANCGIGVSLATELGASLAKKQINSITSELFGMDLFKDPNQEVLDNLGALSSKVDDILKDLQQVFTSLAELSTQIDNGFFVVKEDLSQQHVSRIDALHDVYMLALEDMRRVKGKDTQVSLASLQKNRAYISRLGESLPSQVWTEMQNIHYFLTEGDESLLNKIVRRIEEDTTIQPDLATYYARLKGFLLKYLAAQAKGINIFTLALTDPNAATPGVEGLIEKAYANLAMQEALVRKKMGTLNYELAMAIFDAFGNSSPRSSIMVTLAGYGEQLQPIRIEDAGTAGSTARLIDPAKNALTIWDLIADAKSASLVDVDIGQNYGFYLASRGKKLDNGGAIKDATDMTATAWSLMLVQDDPTRLAIKPINNKAMFGLPSFLYVEDKKTLNTASVATSDQNTRFVVRDAQFLSGVGDTLLNGGAGGTPDSLPVGAMLVSAATSSVVDEVYRLRLSPDKLVFQISKTERSGPKTISTFQPTSPATDGPGPMFMKLNGELVVNTEKGDNLVDERLYLQRGRQSRADQGWKVGSQEPQRGSEMAVSATIVDCGHFANLYFSR